MCAVSNMGDYGKSIWTEPAKPFHWPAPGVVLGPWVPAPGQTVVVDPPKPYNGPTKEQFEEFLQLMRAARKFDVATGQADCPAKEKIDWMRGLAVYLGIDPAKVADALK